METEKNVLEKNYSQIDVSHDGFASDRTKMLTVQKRSGQTAILIIDASEERSS